MGWSGFPISEGDTFQRVVGPLAQVQAAFIERSQAAQRGNDSVYVTAKGEECQSRGFTYQFLQSRIQTLVTYYWNDADNPDPDGESDWGANYTWTRIKQLAGLDSGGWTRKHPRWIESVGDAGQPGQRAFLRNTTDPAPKTWRCHEHNGNGWVPVDETARPDVVVEYGQAEAGDIIGPWIFNEMYAVLNLLKFTAWRATGAGHYDIYSGWTTPPGAWSWSAAKTGAEADYGHYSGPWNSANYDFKRTDGERNPAGGYYIAELSCVVSKHRAYSIFTGVQHSVRAFAKAKQLQGSADTIFDALDSGLVEGQWKEWWSNGPNATNPELADEMMGTGVGTYVWCDEPDYDHSKSRGFEIDGWPWFLFEWHFDYQE